MFKKIFARNVIWFLLLGLLMAHSIDWRQCTIQRGKYLLGIFYNGYFQNPVDGTVYRDYLKTHGITHAFIQSNIQ